MGAKAALQVHGWARWALTGDVPLLITPYLPAIRKMVTGAGMGFVTTVRVGIALLSLYGGY